MFAGLPARVAYAPPWNVDFHVRRSWLRRGTFRIAYIYELEDTSTFRYRVFNMIEALNSCSEANVSASWFTRREFNVDQTFIDSCDLVIICRTRYDEAVARLIERARARGISVFFDVDDLVIDPSMIHRIIVNLGHATRSEADWDYWYSYVGRLRATLEMCDGAITTTPFLAERISAATNGLPCSVVPNFLNRLQVQISESLVASKRRSRYERNDFLTVGFLSGSPSHVGDLYVASRALAEFLAGHPDVRLRMVGFVELNEHLAPFAHRIESIPLSDYLSLQAIAGACEFCIVPLQINTFTMCKSELKFFETGAVGTPVIATPTPPYSAAIVDGQNGFVASAHEWLERLECAYELAVTRPVEYRQMSDRALESSLKAYNWNIQVPTILRAVDRLLEGNTVRGIEAAGLPVGGTTAMGSPLDLG